VTGTDGRTRVAVLGGGVGSIAAAFELTATPELCERFDVTVHQLGWRLGGKGASGRRMEDGARIEEHGLHVWFGFYDNAFRLMRQAYEELGRTPGTDPLATLAEAFEGCDQIVLYDRQGEGWKGFAFNPPPNLQRPGIPHELPTFWEMVSVACTWAIERWVGLRDDRPDLDLAPAPPRFTPAWFGDLAHDLAMDVLRVELAGAEHLLRLAERLATDRARRTDLTYAKHAAHQWFLVRLLSGFRDWLWTHVVADRCDSDPDLRLFFTIFDTIATTTTGLVRDGVLEHGFDSINDEEWCRWLERHGAHRVTLGETPATRSPLLRSVYDVAFGYVGGDISRANVAAGTAINDLLRLVFSYRGSLMFKMQAGMGDTVFAPFYQVLAKRGVKFRFFSAVTELGLSSDGRLVDRIEVVPQVELEGDEYEPLIDVGGLPCWPSEPLWDQFTDGEAHRDAGVDFERDLNPLQRDSDLLRRGEHFDQVVLGISVAGLRPICRQLAERDERFKAMLDSARTVRTQAFQLWVRQDAEALGWAYDTNSVVGCYVEPLDTYCDMSHLLPREAWKAEDGVRSIGYFCGVLPEEGGEPSEEPSHQEANEAKDQVKANAIAFLEHDVGTLWPRAVAGAPTAPLRWELLADRAERRGPGRLEAQYWRANTSLTERYVLTPAGSVEHRLASDDSGFDNLVLAGDWTKNGIDGGCVEAAATSGMQAARKLTGADRPLVGEDPAWLRPPVRGLPRYVEFGGRADSPGPFRCQQGRLRGLLLRGEMGRIEDLVQRTLTEPAAGTVEYRPLTDRVLLLAGAFGDVTSTTPPYDEWGSVREVQLSLWVPVLARRGGGTVFVADRLCLAVPYLLVDNPMSYLGGRDNYGYAKTMGRFEPEEGVGEELRVEAYGGNFAVGETAGWNPLLELAPTGSARAAEAPAEMDGPADFARYLAGGLLDEHPGGELALPGLQLGAELLGDMLRGRATQVFLKQFRDVADGAHACYQSVVEAPLQVTRVACRPSLQEWRVTVHSLDSHPVARELGVASQVASLGFELEMDFVIEEGVEVGGSAVVPSATPRVPAGPDRDATRADQLAALIESAAGLVGRPLSALGRLKWW
jgi:uncharacterized protein with NAD-binding domain and iron-sulfur cluster